MSTIVYQELLHSTSNNYTNNNHSTLSLRLTSTSSNNHYSIPSSSSSSSCDTKTWGAIEALSSLSTCNERNSAYVHPQTKKSSIRLSDKSLEMCTESLGNETGVCIMESSLLNITTTTTTTISSNSKPRQKSTPKDFQSTATTKFPPPLTTMTGSNSIQVRPYREDGRLVIRAVPAASTSRSYLQAERSGGRLRLSFVTETETPSDGQVSGDDDDESVGETLPEIRNKIPSDSQVSECQNTKRDESPSDDQVRSYQNVIKNEIPRYQDLVTRNKNKTLSDSQISNYRNIIRNDGDINEGEGVYFGDEDRNGIKLDLGGKLGKGEFQRLSRCKEGGRGNNKRLVNWEAFWVAT